jgi:cytochrome c-type biogenesis protein
VSDAIGILILGFIYGATMCSVTCLPYMAPYLLLTGNGFREGTTSSLAYLAGKAGTYALWGALAGATGQGLFPDSEAVIRPVQGWILILAGLALPFVSCGACARKSRRAGTKASLFILGASTSLVPCLPVSNMLVAAAKSGSMLTGSMFGFFYGTAIAVAPLLVGGAIAVIGRTLHEEARPFLPYLRGLSMVMLIVIGIRTLI